MKPLPCPRGHEARTDVWFEGRPSKRLYQIRCSDDRCPWRLRGYFDEAAAVSAWNEGRECPECNGRGHIPYHDGAAMTYECERCKEYE